jgi:putative ABC transport system ATP-binding protein
MIELSGISKVYNEGRPNEFIALAGVDLVLEDNRVVVFEGPSGSGKTTLLSLVGCMARPTAGRIRVNGRETSGLPERFTAQIRRRTFGFVFQNYNLIRGLTVLENTVIPGYPEGVPRAQLSRRALRILDRLGIAGRVDRKVEHLSGGEQQRAAIARALINNPEIVIADEPTAHLDTALARNFMQIIGELKAEGRTVLIASHDPRVSQARGVDLIVSMRDGKIEWEQ